MSTHPCSNCGHKAWPMAPIGQLGQTRHQVTKKIKRIAGWRRNIRVCDGLREKRMARVSH